MKNILNKLFGPIVDFFNRIADKEAQRVIETYRQIFEVKTEKGGSKK